MEARDWWQIIQCVHNHNDHLSLIPDNVDRSRSLQQAYYKIAPFYHIGNIAGI